jgi:hypothetical protein
MPHTLILFTSLLFEPPQHSHICRLTTHSFDPILYYKSESVWISNEENATSMTEIFTCVYSISFFSNKAACYCTLVVFCIGE